MIRVLDRIIDQIGQTAPKGIGPERHRQLAFRVQIHSPALSAGLSSRFAQQGREVGRPWLFRAFAPGKGQITVQHVFHFGDIGLQVFAADGVA